MSERMYFEDAPADELCDCVSVALTSRQAQLIDDRPDYKDKIVSGALKKGVQSRDCNAECKRCGGYGIKP